MAAPNDGAAQTIMFKLARMLFAWSTSKLERARLNANDISVTVFAILEKLGDRLEDSENKQQG